MVFPSDLFQFYIEKQKNGFQMETVFQCWRKPIFPGRLQPSIFGTSGLNFRVRDGNGWTPRRNQHQLFSLPAEVLSLTA